MTTAKKGQDKPTVIKKYANRRLYDTGRSSYVTLDDLCIMVKEGREFVVYDAKTGEDLTHPVLTQIIMDQEAKGESLLPVPFLRQLIGFYGDNLQSLLPNYLEQTIESFTKNQEQFREQMSKSFGGMFTPVSSFEDLNRKNMEMFQSAMRTWSSSLTKMQQTGTQSAASAEDKVRDLKKNIAEMQKEIDRLSGR